MKLSIMNEDDLGVALDKIYGKKGRKLGLNRPKLHQTKNDAGIDQGNRMTSGWTGGYGQPWKPRHRRFFRMSNDGSGSLRY